MILRPESAQERVFRLGAMSEEDEEVWRMVSGLVERYKRTTPRVILPAAVYPKAVLGI